MEYPLEIFHQNKVRSVIRFASNPLTRINYASGIGKAIVLDMLILPKCRMHHMQSHTGPESKVTGVFRKVLHMYVKVHLHCAERPDQTTCVYSQWPVV